MYFVWNISSKKLNIPPIDKNRFSCEVREMGQILECPYFRQDVYYIWCVYRVESIAENLNKIKYNLKTRDTIIIPIDEV